MHTIDARHARGAGEGIPWALVGALNLAGLILGAVAAWRLDALTFAAAAAAPPLAIALHAWQPDRFILGDTFFYRYRPFNDPSPGPHASIAIFWAGPGFILAVGGFETPHLVSMTPVLGAAALVGGATALAMLVAERRLRNVVSASSVITACLIIGWGYVTAANFAFDVSRPERAVAVVVSRELVGADKRRNGTPTLHLLTTLAGQPTTRLRVEVSRQDYDLRPPGTHVCFETRPGAFGWRTAGLAVCTS